MTKTEKYLEALKTFDDWVIVFEKALRAETLYHGTLNAANSEFQVILFGKDV